MSRTRQQGFTLIEAAVAIAVVAILSGIIVPLVVKNLNDARNARAQNDVQVIAAAVANQIKDTGRRPSAGAGPGGATGAVANAAWYSGPAPVAAGGAASLTPQGVTVVGGANNTFANLFATAPAAGGGGTAQVLFFGAAAGGTLNPGSEFAYKGPYMALDVANKLDPWGRRYVITGYNATQAALNGPIFVFSAGADGSVLAANWNGGIGPVSGLWDRTTAAAGAYPSQDDIVTRVN